MEDPACCVTVSTNCSCTETRPLHDWSESAESEAQAVLSDAEAPVRPQAERELTPSPLPDTTSWIDPVVAVFVRTIDAKADGSKVIASDKLETKFPSVTRTAQLRPFPAIPRSTIHVSERQNVC